MLCAATGATGSFGGLRPEVQAAADLLLFLTAAGRLRRRLNQTPPGRIVLRSQMSARTSGARVFHIGRRRSRLRRASPLARCAGKAKRRRIMHRRSRRLAQEGTRTPTALRPLVPETSASTNSATWARQTRLGAAHRRASYQAAEKSRRVVSSPPVRRQPAFGAHAFITRAERERCRVRWPPSRRGRAHRFARRAERRR
jgi:hypothetical protein